MAKTATAAAAAAPEAIAADGHTRQGLLINLARERRYRVSTRLVGAHMIERLMLFIGSN
jgi:hypothetical protein